MRKAIVTITWLTRSDGGRVSSPPHSPYVSPISFEGGCENAHWSAVFEFEYPADHSLTHFATADYLSPNAPQDELRVGSAFIICEGKRVVANGVILGIASE